MSNLARNKTDLADTLALHLRAMQLPEPVREYRAIAGRQFRCDLAYPQWKLFIECQGGEQQLGRHNRAYGMEADYEKWNLLTLDGWRGFIFTGRQIKNGVALKMLETWFAAHP